MRKYFQIIPLRKINAVIALRRKVALSSTAITVLTVYIRLIRCRTKKEVGDIVLSSTVPIIRESCIDGRWRNALITGKDTKIVLAKRLSGCFAFQRKWIPDCDGSKLSIERIINLEKRTKYIYYVAIYQLSSFNF